MNCGCRAKRKVRELEPLGFSLVEYQFAGIVYSTSE
jgi:hypothetical protein